MDNRSWHFTAKNRERLMALRRALRRFVLARDGHACRYCGNRRRGALTLDHLLPLSRGGTNGPGNLAAACSRCNQKKGLRTEEEFRERRPAPRALNINHPWWQHRRRRPGVKEM